MGEQSRFFGGPEGAIPQYNQTHDAEVYRLMFSYGVFSDIENELAVTETDPVSLNVKVDTGWAFVHGFWYHNDSALTKSLGAADPEHSRIDRIVLRLDSTTNFKISCEVKEGTPAASPSPPSLTQTDAIYEISLAQVLVEANVTSVSNAKITDERSFAESKGLASVVKLTGDQTIAGVKTFGDGIKTDTINEETANAGVTIDGVKLKDNEPYCDKINEKTSDTGVTIDGVLLKDNGIKAQKRITSITTDNDPAPNADTTDIFIITALEENPTFGAPSGTPTQGQELTIRVKDDGTSRALAYNAIYTGNLPTRTIVGRTLYIDLIYNATNSKWNGSFIYI